MTKEILNFEDDDDLTPGWTATNVDDDEDENDNQYLTTDDEDEPGTLVKTIEISVSSISVCSKAAR